MILYLWAKMFKKIRGVAVKNSTIDKTSKVESGSQIVNSTFGRHSFCGYDCQIINCDVGSFTSIANNVVIGGAQHPMDWVSMSPVFYEGKDSVKTKFSEHIRPDALKTKVGNDVWIGQGALIKAGVSIGDGAVVGMGSVVTKNVEPYCIVAGNPAKMIRKRFDDDVIKVLLDSRWWEWNEQEIIKIARYFYNIDDFINVTTK